MLKIMRITFKRIKSTPLTAVFLLFGLIIAILMVSICTSFMAELLSLQDTKSANKPPNALMFKFNLKTRERLTVEEINKLLGNMDKGSGIFKTDTLLNLDDADVDSYFTTSEEWFSDDTDWHYPIFEGRYYTTDEVHRGSKVALIGKNIKKYIKVENGQRFIKIFGERYEVIGTVGFKGEKSLWDARIFIPLTAVPKLSGGPESGSYVIYNAHKDTQGEIERLLSIAKKDYPEAEVSKGKELATDNLVSTAIINTDILLIIGILGYLVSIVYAINMVSFWIEKRRFEIGIRKAFGYTNFSIATLIFKEMLGLSILGLVFALGIQTVLSLFVNELMGYTITLYLQNIIVGLITIIVTAILTSMWPVLKSLKIQPIESMKL